MIAIYNQARNLMLSPMADGPLQYSGSLMTGQTEVRQLTRYSRTFSLVKVPYSLKLLIQELQAINVRVSIITEDNISQIDNMGFSKNIDLMVNKKDAKVADVIRHINKNIERARPYKSPEVATPIDSVSPIFDPNESGKHVNINQPDDPNYKSPEWATASPAYDPNNIYDPPQMFTPKLFKDDPELQQFYDNMKPKNKAKIENFSDREKQWMVKQLWKRKQEKNQKLDENATNETERQQTVQKGGKVHCRGDKKPQREWVVDKVGNHLYGIYTLDTDDLNPEEHYKYVDPHEIYPLGNYLFVNDVNTTDDSDSDFELPMLPTEDMGFQPQMMPVPPEDTNEKTNINFNPVIKVITDGNDNSQGFDPSTIIQPNGYSPQIQVNPQNMQNPQNISEKQETEGSEIPQTDSNINFNEPIIVKKQ